MSLSSPCLLLEKPDTFCFYVQDKGWIKVKDLQANYVLKTEGSKTELIKTTVLVKEEKVYNIEVEGNHNYFISKSKILVHNK